MSGSLSLVVLTTGPQPNTPLALNTALIAEAEALASAAGSPGLTATLPGSLIEDIASTDTGALVLIDQARVDAVDSVSPLSSNPFVLQQLGTIYLGQGSTASPPQNTGVYVVFTGPAGYVVPAGFVVSDGTNQYTVQDGGAIATGGSSAQLFCLALASGSFAVPANTVVNLVTSVPSGISLAVNNPAAGTPGAAAQTQAEFRAQVLTAGLAASTGMQRYLKTLVADVPGVNANLIAVQQQGSGGWKVIVGGTGDPYQIGGAILDGLFDVSTLVGSSILVTNITNATLGVVTTNLNHGYSASQAITIAGVTPSAFNVSATINTIISETSFSISVNTTGSGAYVSGGVVTPNFRNITVSVSQTPDVYTVIFVVPPVQTVTMVVTWNTLPGSNFVSSSGVATLAQPALAAYVNQIQVGQPINILQMNAVFQAAVLNILPATILDRLVFAISINGISTAQGSGTYIVSGDPESYFTCVSSGIEVIQG